jgi:uncharacterized protein DUF6538
MDDGELAKPPIFRRGNVWWVRKRVPVDLARYPGEQMRKSLHTEARREAVGLYPRALAEIERDFARTRAELHKQGNVAGALALGKLELLGRADIEHLVATWWTQRQARQQASLGRLETEGEREAGRPTISPLNTATAAWCQFSIGQSGS